MDRVLWDDVVSVEQELGFIYRKAKAQGDYHTAVRVQAARARLHTVMAAHRHEFTAPDPLQLSLVSQATGREHDTDPAG